MSIVKASIQRMKAYQVLQESEGIKMNQNEFPGDLPEEIKIAVLDRMTSLPWNRYPDNSALRLVKRLARHLGFEVLEQSISREQLYAADEIFLTGTAVEVTPVRKVDHITIGAGRRGPVTKQVQDAFFGLFDGRTEDQWGWLESL